MFKALDYGSDIPQPIAAGGRPGTPNARPECLLNSWIAVGGLVLSDNYAGHMRFSPYYWKPKGHKSLRTFVGAMV